jgi:hypothetical protein
MKKHFIDCQVSVQSNTAKYYRKDTFNFLAILQIQNYIFYIVKIFFNEND